VLLFAVEADAIGSQPAAPPLCEKFHNRPSRVAVPGPRPQARLVTDSIPQGGEERTKTYRRPSAATAQPPHRTTRRDGTDQPGPDSARGRTPRLSTGDGFHVPNRDG